MANFPSQELAQDKNPHGETPAPELKGKHLSHATGAQPATQPAKPHSDSTGEELWREKEKLALAWLEETLPPIGHSLSTPVYFK